MAIRKALLGVIIDLCLLSAVPSRAAVIVNASQVGSDVLFSFSGTFDVSGLNKFSGFANSKAVFPQAGAILFNGSGLLDAYTMQSLPAFGTGPAAVGTAAGDYFKIAINGLAFAQGYAGELISGSLSVYNQSFITLGLIAGSYKTTASNGDYVQLNIPRAVPIPGALPLLASGLGALGFVGWRRKGKGATA